MSQAQVETTEARKHVVNVSGGSSSAVALLRCIERYGKESVIARFADTRDEDPDCYRFIDDVEKFVGLEIVRLQDGRNCWDVWHEKMMLTNPQSTGCVASYWLKKKQLELHNATIEGEFTVHIGFLCDEEDRVARLLKNDPVTNYDFPLRWKPSLSECDVDRILRRLGITPPAMYQEGYTHANCNRRCILAGTTQWTGVLRDRPDLFAEYEAEEQKFLARLRELGRKEFTILTDRRGGDRKNLSLKQLREEIEAGIRNHTNDWKACGCHALLFDSPDDFTLTNEASHV